MVNVKKYKLKENLNIKDILDNGFEYSLDRKHLTKFVKLKGSIVLYIKMPLVNLDSFHFYNDIDVLDDDFCQPYMPFYNNHNNEVSTKGYLMDVITRYNEEMDKISVFEEIIK